MRTEPPPSVPRATGPQPLATAAAAPPLLPPGVCATLQGLRVTPKSWLSVTALNPNSDVVVLPRSTAPEIGGRRAAAAAAGRVRDAPGVAGHAEELAVGHGLEPELRRRRLTEEHRARDRRPPRRRCCRRACARRSRGCGSRRRAGCRSRP